MSKNEQMIKRLFLTQLSLMQERTVLEKKLEYAKKFFNSPSAMVPQKCADAIGILQGVIEELTQLDNKMKQNHSMMIATYELLSGEIDIKVTLPSRTNDIGDVSPREEIIVSADEELYDKFANVLPIDSLWVYVLVKELFKVDNLEIVNKGE